MAGAVYSKEIISEFYLILFDFTLFHFILFHFIQICFIFICYVALFYFFLLFIIYFFSYYSIQFNCRVWHRSAQLSIYLSSMSTAWRWHTAMLTLVSILCCQLSPDGNWLECLLLHIPFLTGLWALFILCVHMYCILTITVQLLCNQSGLWPVYTICTVLTQPMRSQEKFTHSLTNWHTEKWLIERGLTFFYFFYFLKFHSFFLFSLGFCFYFLLYFLFFATLFFFNFIIYNIISWL